MKPLEIGAEAPDFALPRKIGEAPFRLSAQRGRPVVILFFPLAFSSVCTQEMCTVAEDWESWSELDAVVVGISVDSAFVNHRFAEVTAAPFPILSDFNKDTIRVYGVLNEDYFGMRGVANRSVFVVDPQGIIRYVWTDEDSSVLPDFAAVKEALAGV